jgi:vacuolar-type H+-ATPase subunit I/STV1
MMLVISIIILAVAMGFMGQYAVGQDENLVGRSGIVINDTAADQIIKNLERIIEQNNGSSRSSLLSSYIGMMSFLVGLALVIFGLQLSRGEKATPAAMMAYRILILALLLPVVGLYVFAVVRADLGEVANDYLGVASLLMIPAGAVLVIMALRLHTKL